MLVKCLQKKIMNFSIYLNQKTGKELDAIAKKERVSRNSLIAEAIELLLKSRKEQQWSQEVLEWQGCPEFELKSNTKLLLSIEEVL